MSSRPTAPGEEPELYGGGLPDLDMPLEKVAAVDRCRIAEALGPLLHEAGTETIVAGFTSSI